MTIVAYRDRIIAADSGGWNAEFVVGSFQKITRSDAGVLAGGSGEAGCITKFLAWVRDGQIEADRPTFDDDGGFHGFTVAPSGIITGYSWRMLPFDVDAEFFGCGCGYPLAMGAMLMGATAEQAVNLAIEFSECRGPLQLLRL